MKNPFSKFQSFMNDKLKPMLKKPLFWVIAIPSFLALLFIGFVASAIIAGFIDVFSVSTFALKSPKSTEWATEQPSEYIMFTCTNIQQIELNGKILSEKEFQSACSSSGYKLEFEGGENTYTFIGRKVSTEDSYSIALKVTFDSETYQRKLAEKQAELEQKNAEAIKAKQEEDERKLAEWKKKYTTVKKEYIGDAYEKSKNMINAFSNSTDLYQTRKVANNYKDYFLYTCKKDLNTELSSYPSIIKEEDIKNLNSYYSDYCMYNEFLARQVIKYTETDKTAKQYDALDQITYYKEMINSSKIGVEENLILLDAAIK